MRVCCHAAELRSALIELDRFGWSVLGICKRPGRNQPGLEGGNSNLQLSELRASLLVASIAAGLRERDSRCQQHHCTHRLEQIILPGMWLSVLVLFGKVNSQSTSARFNDVIPLPGGQMRKLLFLLIAVLPVVAQMQKSTAALAEPAISPDAREIAFVSGGDIWTVSAGGGEARLLIAHPANESRPLYSPDGKYLA